MEQQSELGKTEEEKNIASSAELPEPESAPVTDSTDVEATVQTPSELGPEATEVAPETSPGEPADAPDVAADAEQPVADASADVEAAEAVVAEASSESSADSAPATDSTPDPAVPSAETKPASDTPRRPRRDEVVNGLRRGDLVEGTVLRTSPTAVEIDLGEERVGIVPARELELMTKKVLESLREGEKIIVYVVNPRNPRGEIVLSINHALEEQDWREASEYLDNKQVYDAKIGGYNKGGLIVRFGRLRGFVPQSQIAETRLRQMAGETPEERYGKMVNNDISVKVMEVDRSRNRLILSERAAMREVRQRRKEAIITEVGLGEIREGVVVSLENFGAFVDIGGAEGLVHLTEISWRHVTHPRQALNVGDPVKVKIISVDPDNNRIGLSIRQLQEDPWDEVAARFSTGTLVRGAITKLTKFGAFARITAEEAVEGLIHISELSDDRVEHPREVVKKGDVLTLRVVKVDIRNRRLGLSLKRVNSPEFLDRDIERAYQEGDAPAIPDVSTLEMDDDDDDSAE